jgi:hypothetical protein
MLPLDPIRLTDNIVVAPVQIGECSDMPTGEHGPLVFGRRADVACREQITSGENGQIGGQRSLPIRAPRLSPIRLQRRLSRLVLGA